MQRSVRELRSQLELGRVDATAARRALEPVLGFDARAALRGSLRADRVSIVTMGRRFAGDDPGPLPVEFDAPAWANALGRRALARFALDVQVVLDLDRPTWRELGARLPPWRRPGPILLVIEGWGAPLVNTTRILFPRVLLTAARLAATQSLVRLSLAAVEQFDSTGAWPESLEDIEVDPAHRIDPFTDWPFEFERLPDGIRISSSGPDDVAVWGERVVERNDPQADGLVWTLRR